jgi:hypothetical protein
MADNVAFRALLENRMNLTAATTDAIEDQGITTLAELSDLDYDDIKSMVMNILKFIAPNAAAGDVIRVPFVAQKKLYAAKYWYELQLKCGQAAPAGGLTNAELTLALQRRKEVDERKAATKDQELTKPPKLTSFKDWVNWWELWDTYMQQTYGSADIPLSYTYREHEVVTAAMRAAAYNDDDDKYIATTVLQGRHYQLDNRRVWNELKPLVVDGPGWVFIQTLEDTKKRPERSPHPQTAERRRKLSDDQKAEGLHGPEEPSFHWSKKTLDVLTIRDRASKGPQRA